MSSPWLLPVLHIAVARELEYLLACVFPKPHLLACIGPGSHRSAGAQQPLRCYSAADHLSPSIPLGGLMIPAETVPKQPVSLGHLFPAAYAMVIFEDRVALL
ncbi:MAG: hypothetical protein GX162_09515 [Firmicutes bacterium]|jgi:hypothetical protein|nr:hypothetical protein [Bacillota bacterium]